MITELTPPRSFDKSSDSLHIKSQPIMETPSNVISMNNNLSYSIENSANSNSSSQIPEVQISSPPLSTNISSLLSPSSSNSNTPLPAPNTTPSTQTTPNTSNLTAPISFQRSVRLNVSEFRRYPWKHGQKVNESDGASISSPSTSPNTFDNHHHNSNSINHKEVINFSRPDPRLCKNLHCVMCGESNVHIPSQNKNICKICDSSFWLHNSLNIVFKFCKGCKNFFILEEFSDKPEGTKCRKCRQRGRDNYLNKKSQGITNSTSNYLNTPSPNNNSLLISPFPSASSELSTSTPATNNGSNRVAKNLNDSSCYDDSPQHVNHMNYLFSPSFSSPLSPDTFPSISRSNSISSSLTASNTASLVNSSTSNSTPKSSSVPATSTPSNSVAPVSVASTSSTSTSSASTPNNQLIMEFVEALAQSYFAVLSQKQPSPTSNSTPSSDFEKSLKSKQDEIVPAIVNAASTASTITTQSTPAKISPSASTSTPINLSNSISNISPQPTSTTSSTPGIIQNNSLDTVMHLLNLHPTISNAFSTIINPTNLQNKNLNSSSTKKIIQEVKNKTFSTPDWNSTQQSTPMKNLNSSSPMTPSSTSIENLVSYSSSTDLQSKQIQITPVKRERDLLDFEDGTKAKIVKIEENQTPESSIQLNSISNLDNNTITNSSTTTTSSSISTQEITSNTPQDKSPVAQDSWQWNPKLNPLMHLAMVTSSSLEPSSTNTSEQASSSSSESKI